MMNPLNPLDLHGPAFLAFYAAVGGAVVTALVVFQRLHETAAIRPNTFLTDPYLVAYLRGGEMEAMRVALVTLYDRGLLEADDTWFSLTSQAADARAGAPLEQALLDHFADGPGIIAGALEQPAVRGELQRLEAALVEQGLLPSSDQHLARGLRLFAAAAVLFTVTCLQLVNRDSRSGIGFLILLTLAFTALAAFLSFRRRTAAGNRALGDLRELLHGGRQPVTGSGSGAHVPALVMAAYGLAMLPGAEYAFLGNAQAPVPKPRPDRDGRGECGGCGGSSSGSSDSSGSGDGGGASGGDGGGGCGGGCGGCGCGG
jgi:uncharacterized protein (TIGR04222 family)